jgi:hypothetical protein
MQMMMPSQVKGQARGPERLLPSNRRNRFADNHTLKALKRTSTSLSLAYHSTVDGPMLHPDCAESITEQQHRVLLSSSHMSKLILFALSHCKFLAPSLAWQQAQRELQFQAGRLTGFSVSHIFPSSIPIA